MPILLYLYERQEKGKISIGEVKRNVKAASDTVISTVTLLALNGLLNEDLEPKIPFRHWVWLTEKGVQVAARLVEVAHALHSLEHLGKNQDV